jgi:hypothetical protein
MAGAYMAFPLGPGLESGKESTHFRNKIYKSTKKTQ